MEDYKGYAIIFDENKGIFIAYTKDKNGIRLDDKSAQSETFKGLKSKLDELSKKKFNIPAIVNKSYEDENYWEGRITSMRPKDDEYRSQEYRVSFPNKSWSDERAKSLIKVTDDNRTKIGVIKDKRKQIENLEKEIERIEKTLETFTDKELQKP